jgi:hypothetical protein
LAGLAAIAAGLVAGGMGCGGGSGKVIQVIPAGTEMTVRTPGGGQLVFPVGCFGRDEVVLLESVDVASITGISPAVPQGGIQFQVQNGSPVSVPITATFSLAQEQPSGAHLAVYHGSSGGSLNRASGSATVGGNGKTAFYEEITSDGLWVVASGT